MQTPPSTAPLQRILRWLGPPLWCGLLWTALAADPGSVAWRVESHGSLWGTPAVGTDGAIYSVLTPPEPARDVLVALHPDGSERWRLELAARGHQPPILDGAGQVLLTRSNGVVRAFGTNGLPMWQLTLRLEGASGAALAPDGSFHLAGVDSSRDATYVIVNPDGSVRQRGPLAARPLPSLVPRPGHPPQVGGDGFLVYLSTGLSSGNSDQGGISNTVAVIVQDSTGAPALGAADSLAIPGKFGLSLRHANGQEYALWSRAEVTSSPVLRPDGVLCFASADHRLHAITTAGTELWSADAGSPVRATPLVLDGDILVAATDAGRLFAVDASGALLWERMLSGPVTAHLNVLPDGKVLAADEGGTLWCITSGAAPAVGGWPKWQSDPSNSGRNPAPPVVLQAPAPPTGADEGSLRITWSAVPGARRYEIWRDTTPGGAGTAQIGTADWTAWSDFGIESGVRYSYQIRAVRGSEQGPYSTPIEIAALKFLWRRTVGDGASGLAMLSDGSLVTVASSGTRSEVVALHRDGTERWRRPLSSSVLNPPLVTGLDQIWIHTRTGLAQFTADGTPVVFVPTAPEPGEERPSPMALGQEGALYAPVLRPEGARLLVLDSTTGRIRGDSPMEDPGGWVLSSLTGHDGAVLLLGRDRVICHEPGTQRRWSRRMDAFGAAVLTDGDYVIGTTQGLVRMTPSGQPRWTNGFRWDDISAFGMPGLVVDPQNVTYVRHTRGLRAIAADGDLLWNSSPSIPGSSRNEPFLDASGGIHLTAGGRIFHLDHTGAQVSQLASMLSQTPSPFALLDASGQLFLCSASGSLSALNLGVGVATNAPWPLPRHDVGNRASTAKHAVPAPSAVTTEASPWVGGNRVRWTPSGSLVDHVIYRADSPNFSQAARIGVALASDDHFDDSSAVSGSSRYYWVLASNAVGVSPAVSPAPVTGRAPTVRAQTALPEMVPALSPVPVVRPDGSVVAGNGTGWTVAMDLDGRPLWTNRISVAVVSQVYQMLSDAAGQIFLATANGLFRITPDGSSFTKLTANVGTLSLGPDGLLRLRAGQNLVLQDPGGEAAGSAVSRDGFDLSGFVRSDGLSIAQNASGTLRAMDAAWVAGWETNPGTVAIAPGTTSTVLALGLDGSIFLALGNQALTALDPLGRPRWQQPLEAPNPIVHGAALGPWDQILWVLSQERSLTRTLRALDPDSGLERWRFTRTASTSTPYSSPAATDDGTVLLADQNTLWALDGTTGSVRWGFEGRGLVGPPVVHEDGSILFTAGDELVVLRGGSPPAFSGWPMVGHDSRGSRSQGARGKRDLTIATTAGDAPEVTLQATDGNAFIPLVSEDLRHWRPSSGSFQRPPSDRPEAGPSFIPHLEGARQFFRGVSP